MRKIAISSLKGKATHQTSDDTRIHPSNYWYLTPPGVHPALSASKTSLSWSFRRKCGSETKEYKAVKIQRATQKKKSLLIFKNQVVQLGKDCKLQSL